MSVKTYPSKTPDLVRTLTDASAPSMGWQTPVDPATVLPMAEEDREVGKRLQLLRERRGWSRETLAYHADVSQKTVERIEKGIVEARRGTFRSLARALEVDEYAILGEPPGPQGVGLSDQIGSVDEKFTALVDQIFSRDDHHRTEMYRRLDTIATALEERATHDGRMLELIARQNELLAQQSQLLALIRVLLGIPEDEQLSLARAAEAARDWAARTAQQQSERQKSS